MARDNETEFLKTMLKGNTEAVGFCQCLFRVSQVIDDLYDRDKDVTPAQVHESAWAMLVELPSNAFYLANFNYLQPLIRGALVDWMDSCDLEAGNGHDQSIAFVLRDNLTALVSHCALLIGGYHYMRAVSPDIRRFFHDETLPDYIEGLAAETKEA